VCRVSHTARIIELRADMAGTTNIIISYHIRCFRFEDRSPGARPCLFLRHQTPPRSENG
jgi:hypothetical protein